MLPAVWILTPIRLKQQPITRNFTIASWQKITEPNVVYKIYIEGGLGRELAFGDNSPNMIHLARKICFYISILTCNK